MVSLSPIGYCADVSVIPVGAEAAVRVNVVMAPEAGVVVFFQRLIRYSSKSLELLAFQNRLKVASVLLYCTPWMPSKFGAVISSVWKVKASVLVEVFPPASRALRQTLYAVRGCKPSRVIEWVTPGA
jgi:hypothetical protein